MTSYRDSNHIKRKDRRQRLVRYLSEKHRRFQRSSVVDTPVMTATKASGDANIKQDAEQNLLNYLSKFSSEPRPRRSCRKCKKTKMFYCEQCLEIVLPPDERPAGIQDLRLPFDLDVILDAKERRSSSTGIHLAAIWNSFAPSTFSVESLKQELPFSSDNGGEQSRAVGEGPSDVRREKETKSTEASASVRLFHLGRDRWPNYEETTESDGTYVLFPSDGSVAITSVATSIRRLVVLDCKWTKTAMCYNEAIKDIRRVHLVNPPLQSYYWRWHSNQFGTGMLSTIEAVYFAAWEVATAVHLDWPRKQTENLVHLLWLFAMQRAIIAQRSIEEDRLLPFSDEGKSYQRSLRKKQIGNPSQRGKNKDSTLVAAST